MLCIRLSFDRVRTRRIGRMKHSIEHGPAFAWLRTRLEAGEQVDAAAGAMVTATADVRPGPTRPGAGRPGNLLVRVWLLGVRTLRRVLGRPTPEVEAFLAPEGGELVFAPDLPGGVSRYAISADRSLLIQASAFLASAGVQRKARFSGFRGLLQPDPLHFIEVHGEGEVFLAAYGGCHPLEVEGKLLVDTGHLLAFEPSLRFSVRPAARGLRASLFSGEGLVCVFEGQGKVWIQARNPEALAEFIAPHVNA